MRLKRGYGESVALPGRVVPFNGPQDYGIVYIYIYIYQEYIYIYSGIDVSGCA